MGKVFKFEFLTGIKKKSFIISVAIMFVLTMAVSFIPMIVEYFSKGDKDVVGIYSTEDFANAELATKVSGVEFADYDSKEQLEKDVKSGDLYAGYVIDGDKREAFLKSSSMSNMGKISSISKSLSMLESTEMLKKEGVSQTIIDNTVNGVDYNINTLETDGAKNFVLIYILIMVLYFLMIMFGNQVAMSVAREKSDRTMELLITSSKPKDLIRGKVYATALIGILVLSILVVGLFIGSKFAPPLETQNEIGKILNISISIDQLIVSLSFFVVGYIMFLYLFACAASLVSKIEDLGMAMQPLSLVYVAGFMISMFGMGNPGLLLKVASWVPLTSPFAMITRYGVDSVPQWEVIGSFLVLFVFTVFVAFLSIKIYRFGALNYGTKPKFFRNVIKALKK